MSQLYLYGAALVILVIMGAALYYIGKARGRGQEREKDLKALGATEREIRDAVDTARRRDPDVTRDWLQRGSDPQAPADQDPGKPPGGH